MTIAPDRRHSIPTNAPRPAGAAGEDELSQIRATTHRLLAAVQRLADPELLHPSASGLGTRRHVVARLIRHARRAALQPGADPTALLASDRLLHCPAEQLSVELSDALGAVIRQLSTPSEPRSASADTAAQHLAWLELTHVDLAVGFDIHDIPAGSIDAVAAHLDRARSGAENSPFTLLVSDER